MERGLLQWGNSSEHPGQCQDGPEVGPLEIFLGADVSVGLDFRGAEVAEVYHWVVVVAGLCRRGAGALAGAAGGVRRGYGVGADFGGGGVLGGGFFDAAQADVDLRFRT
jgi:hypothetical protein